MQGDLERARALIKAKRYTEARRILQTLPHDETARRWLTRLDGLMPAERPTPSRQVPLIALGILAVLLLLTGGVLIGKFALPAPSAETIVQIVTATAAPATQTPVVMPTLPPDNAALFVPTTEVSTTLPESGRWVYSEEVNDFDGETAALAVLPGSVLDGWIGDAQSSLAVACNDQFFFVALQSAGGGFEREDYLSDSYPFRVRFDDGAVETLEGTISDDGNFVTFLSDIDLVRRLLAHDRMRVEMKPFSSSTQTADFDLRGLSVSLARLEQFCNRKMS